MWLFYFSVSLAIVANIFYHIIQKSTPGNVNPLISLIVTYFIAMVTCVVIYPFYPHEEGIITAFKKLNWTSICLGVAIVGLEMGFLLAYRSGWNINAAGVFVNVVVGLVLIPLGLLLFKEQLSLANAAGIVLCIGGLVLIAGR
jgi:uncharacterized membrane protein